MTPEEIKARVDQFLSFLSSLAMMTATDLDDKIMAVIQQKDVEGLIVFLVIKLGGMLNPTPADVKSAIAEYHAQL